MGVLRERVGARIRQLRKAAGLTQEQLAQRAEMDYKYLGSIERGERNVTLDNVERIVKALGVEPYELFLFTMHAPKPAEKVNEEVLVNLVKHTDASLQPVLVNLVQTVLRWAHARKK